MPHVRFRIILTGLRAHANVSIRVTPICMAQLA
jgi:hypothetical protein